MAKISVCIPVYNSEIWFAQSVQSIIDQTFTDWEIVAVNDGSTDDIDLLFSHYEKLLGDKFRCISNHKNLGIAATRNRAIEVATGEIICVQDADDISHKERLKKTWDFFKKHKKTDLLYGGFQIINALDKATQEVPGKEFDEKFLRKHNYICHGSVAFRKSIKVRYRESHKVIDDWFFYMDVLKAGYKIGWMEDTLCFHRELATGVSLSAEKRDQIIEMREKFRKEFNADLSPVAN